MPARNWCDPCREPNCDDCPDINHPPITTKNKLWEVDGAMQRPPIEPAGDKRLASVPKSDYDDLVALAELRGRLLSEANAEVERLREQLYTWCYYREGNTCCGWDTDDGEYGPGCPTCPAYPDKVTP